MTCWCIAEEIQELHAKEKELGIQPDPQVEKFALAAAVSGKRESITTDLIIKLLGLDVCPALCCLCATSMCTSLSHLAW